MKNSRSLNKHIKSGIILCILWAPPAYSDANSFLSQIRTRTDRNLGVSGKWYELKTADWVFYGDEAAPSTNMGAIPDGMKVEVLKWNNFMARVRLPDGRVVFVRNRLLNETTAPSASEKARLARLTSQIGQTELFGGDPSRPPSELELAALQNDNTPSAAATVVAATGTVTPAATTPTIVAAPPTTVVKPTLPKDKSRKLVPPVDTSVVQDGTAVLGTDSPPLPIPRPQIKPIDLSQNGIPVTGANLGEALPTAPLSPAPTSATQPTPTGVYSVNGTPLNVVNTAKPSYIPPAGVSAPTPGSDLALSSDAPVPRPRPQPGFQQAEPTAILLGPADGNPKVMLPNGRLCDPNKQWQTPLRETFRITDCLGTERSGGARHHAGIDIAGREPGMQGNAVYPSAKGKVVASGHNGGYGCYVRILHNHCPGAMGQTLSRAGCTTSYSHMQTRDGRCDVPPVGTNVTPCDRIGGMSGTGVNGRRTDYASHLHFELHTDSGSTIVNPTAAIPALIESPDRATQMVCHSKRNIMAIKKSEVNSRGAMTVHTHTHGVQ